MELRRWDDRQRIVEPHPHLYPQRRLYGDTDRHRPRRAQHPESLTATVNDVPPTVNLDRPRDGVHGHSHCLLRLRDRHQPGCPGGRLHILVELRRRRHRDRFKPHTYLRTGCPLHGHRLGDRRRWRGRNGRRRRSTSYRAGHSGDTTATYYNLTSPNPSTSGVGIPSGSFTVGLPNGRFVSSRGDGDPQRWRRGWHLHALECGPLECQPHGDVYLYGGQGRNNHDRNHE